MANVTIAWGNEIDRATLSGGLWLGTLPLANLQQRPLGEPARSNGLALTSTQFDVVFSGRLPPVECVALVGHNLSPAALWKITAYNASEGKTRTTGWMQVWPPLSPAEMEWEDDPWFTGTPDADLIAQFTPLLTWTGGRDLWPANQDTANPKRWRIEIDDATNPAGYVQIGRVFIGRAFTPRWNMSWGVGLGYQTGTKVEESLLGAEFFDRRDPVRVMRFSLDHLADAEAYGAVLMMQRRLGIDGELLVIPDADQPEFRLQRNLYGRLRSLAPFEHNYYQGHSAAFEIKEIIA